VGRKRRVVFILGQVLMSKENKNDIHLFESSMITIILIAVPSDLGCEIRCMPQHTSEYTNYLSSNHGCSAAKLNIETTN
jgi:hypothetical protein